jgi:hypothetical protein
LKAVWNNRKSPWKIWKTFRMNQAPETRQKTRDHDIAPICMNLKIVPLEINDLGNASVG